MVLVTSHDNGPNMVCESSCVFPQDDEMFSSIPKAGKADIRFYLAIKRGGGTFTDKNAIYSPFSCVRTSLSCLLVD